MDIPRATSRLIGLLRRIAPLSCHEGTSPLDDVLAASCVFVGFEGVAVDAPTLPFPVGGWIRAVGVHLGGERVNCAEKSRSDRVSAFGEAPRRDRPAVSRMAALISGDLLQDVADSRHLAALRHLCNDPSRDSLVEGAIDQRVDGQSREGEPARPRKSRDVLSLGKRCRAETLSIERLRKRKAQLGVADLVKGVLVGGGDQCGRSSKCHEVQSQPCEGRDRGVLGLAVVAPLIGKLRWRRLGVTEGNWACRPGGVKPKIREEHPAEPTDLTTTGEPSGCDVRDRHAQACHQEISKHDRSGRTDRHGRVPSQSADNHEGRAQRTGESNQARYKESDHSGDPEERREREQPLDIAKSECEANQQE